MHMSTNNGQVPPFTPIPWWGSSGSQEEHGNSDNMNPFDWVHEHQKSVSFNEYRNIMDHSDDKELVFQAPFPAGENNNSFKENSMDNDETNSSQQLRLQLQLQLQLPLPSSQQNGFIELGLGQPMAYPNYPLGDRCRGLFSDYGTPPVGHGMLPFSLSTEDGPIYLNPKQYHGIMRRRKMRAKERLKCKSPKEKPYLHESRHRHACRRPRGAGGRFLNTKSLDDQKNDPESKRAAFDQLFPSSGSSGSEVLQSESVNLNSSQQVSDSKTLNFSPSEASSMYYSKELDCFGDNPSRPFPFHPLSNFDFFKD